MNKNVKYAKYGTLTGEFRKDYYAIDFDNDGSYIDDDAYDSYNWNLLVYSNTFSAANAMTSICKNMGIATILGETSGGGMCSVMPCSLMMEQHIELAVTIQSAIHGITQKLMKLYMKK